MEDALSALRAALPDHTWLHYSLKANPHPDVVRELIGLGCLAEVSSVEELSIAVGSGAQVDQCLYTGPGKTSGEIRDAITTGVRRFSVESEQDYARVAKIAGEAATRVECLLRINGSPRGATGLRMVGPASQFGIDLGILESRRAGFAPSMYAGIAGLHCFPLNNARDEASLIESFTASIDAAAAASKILDAPIGLIDLGGGFASPYAEPGDRPQYGRLRTSLELALDRQFPGWRRGEPRIAFESGRYLVGSSGTLTCAVMDVKRVRDRMFVILDGGVNHLGGMAGLGRLMRPGATPEDQNEVFRVTH